MNVLFIAPRMAFIQTGGLDHVTAKLSFLCST